MLNLIQHLVGGCSSDKILNVAAEGRLLQNDVNVLNVFHSGK